MHRVTNRLKSPLRPIVVLTTLIGIVVWSLTVSAPAGMSQPLASTTGTASPTPSPRAGTPPPVALPPDDLAILHTQFYGGGGGNNVVNLVNQQNGGLRIRGAIQLNRIPGPTVAPVNEAQAESSCTGCQSIAVALQINLVSRTATFISPRNSAVAINYECSGCTTVARALQYTIPVDDPSEVPQSVRNLLLAMDGELKSIEHGDYATLGDAEAAINGVISQFTGLAQYLSDQRQVQSN